MGGLNTSKTKYVLLYGEPDSGKTLFQYQLQSNINLNTEEIKSTFGISYETLSIGDCELGMFDLSGSIKQYDIVKIVTKFVDISGIIFIVSLTTLDRIDESKDSLERILGNNFLSSGQCLYVIYNKKDLGDKLDWMDANLLDNRLGIPKMKKKYKLKSVESQIIDINKIKSYNLEGLIKFQEALTDTSS